MGNQASPNVVFALVDLATGANDTGETVEILLQGDTYPGDAIALSEIGVTGIYKFETADATPAILQGTYSVYAGGVFRAVYIHGNEDIQDHMDDTTNPHAVIAVQVPITDAGGLITATDVEEAIQELATDLATKADSGTALLLDNSSQSVDASKPTVTNLDADQVDGHDAGSSSGNVPILDSAGLLPLTDLPTDLTGKNADQVDGHDVGFTAGDIPELSATGEANKLDTTVLGKKVGITDDDLVQLAIGAADAGKVHETLTAKKVGVADDNIPQISTDAVPDTGKIHESLLGILGSRTATGNQSDVPEPDTYGGGPVWAVKVIPDNTTPIVLDTSIDWRDRIITINGWAIENASAAFHLPGGANDDLISDSDFGADNIAPKEFVQGVFYSEQGSASAGVRPHFIDASTLTAQDFYYIWADSTTGNLMCGKAATTNGSVYGLMLKIDYSPIQNHY